MKIQETAIPGLMIIDLDIHEDERGSFREIWQEEKAEAAGLPLLNVKQCNVAQSRRGVTRGIHIEPWDKYIHIAQGTAFAAIVDMREGKTRGAVETVELDRTKALYVPEGCGNSYQALTDDVLYMYMVTDIWKPDANYTAIKLDDPTLDIEWPLPEEEWIISEKDKANDPFL